MKAVTAIVVASLASLPHGNSFTPRWMTTMEGRCCWMNNNNDGVLLYMAKSKSLLKQADLRRKMGLAKQQKMEEGQDNNNNNSDEGLMTALEIRERNDRLRFRELLQREAGNVLNDYGSDSYLNKQQEEEEIVAARKGIDRIFEGDPAPTECFEDLVSVQTATVLGTTGKQQLVPWLRENNDNLADDYLIIVSDPRPASVELQETVKQFQTDLPDDMKRRLVVINADSVAENKRWMKKMSDPTTIRVYSDEKLSWMRAYTALGETRWSMTLYIIAAEKVQKMAREVDQYGASKAIQNAVKSLR